jgi:hypothetical protein
MKFHGSVQASEDPTHDSRQRAHRRAALPAEWLLCKRIDADIGMGDRDRRLLLEITATAIAGTPY